jgi:orotate phosphoribosyltransferase
MNWQNNKTNFYKFIIDNNVIGIFKEPIKLKSNRLSPFYVNWRNIAEDVFLIDILADFIISFVRYLNLQPDCFYGVPEGATKIGIITQYKWARMQKNFKLGTYKLSMGRGKPKDHGDPKDMYFLGIPKGKTLIIEDVTTTGESLVESIEKLNTFNIEIIGTIGLTNRNEIRDDGKSVEEIVQERGIKYYTMSNAVDLLSNLKTNKEVSRKIEDYYNKYGSIQFRSLH